MKRDFVDGNGNLKKNQITPPSESIGGAVGGGAEFSSQVYTDMYIGIDPPHTDYVGAGGWGGGGPKSGDRYLEQKDRAIQRRAPPPSIGGAGGGRANE